MKALSSSFRLYVMGSIPAGCSFRLLSPVSSKRMIIILPLILFFMVTAVNAQVPHGINYQALALDGTGEPIRDEAIDVRFTILYDTVSPVDIYVETHNKVITNRAGLFSLVIGTGDYLSGEVKFFSDIHWASGSVFLVTDIYYRDNWHNMGTSKIWSVPYSLAAGSLTGALNSLVVAGTTTSMEEPLFIVRNRNGDPVFEVYNEGVRVTIGDGVGKATKGGFAIGSFDRTKGSVQDLLLVNSDSTRFYIDDNMTKATKGGFAIGSFDRTKGVHDSYFDISPASETVINPSEPRILWYPLKNAFLAGQVLIENPAHVGENSMAIGFENRASGNYSQALGYRSSALGEYSTAIGRSAYADNQNAFAFGLNAIAQGSSSYAIGDGATTNTGAANSYAIGKDALASGLGSYAFGNGAIATGSGSFAFGAGGRDSTGVALAGSTEAIGSNSFAMGLGARAQSLNSFSIGTGAVASGVNSTAMGYQTTASGRFAIAMGFKNVASGRSSTAFGGVQFANIEYPNLASGEGSTAFGYGTTASGRGSTSFGSNSVATGTHSTAWGYHSKAYGYNATAWGWNSTAEEESSTAWGGGVARASRSTAVGPGVFATSHRLFAVGGYNDTIYTNNTPWYSTGKPTSFFSLVPKDPIFVVGNGDGHPLTGRKNAFTVLKNGTTIVGWDSSVDNTALNPTARYDLSVNIAYDNNYMFYVHGKAGGETSWTVESDSRAKKDISTIDDALNKVMQLRGVTFRWNDPNREGLNIGFLAQETLSVLPEVVTGTDETTYSMQYAPITALLVEAIKEQQAEIDALSSKVTDLESQLIRMRDLEARLTALESLLLNEKQKQ